MKMGEKSPAASFDNMSSCRIEVAIQQRSWCGEVRETIRFVSRCRAGCRHRRNRFDVTTSKVASPRQFCTIELRYKYSKYSPERKIS